MCTLRSGNPKDAEQYFERALRLQPDDADSLLNLGEIRYKQGKMDEARRLVSRYNKLDEPSAQSLWLALGFERDAIGRSPTVAGIAVACAAHRAQVGRARRRAELCQPAAAALSGLGRVPVAAAGKV